MIAYRDATADDLQSWQGMNDFDRHQPPLVAEVDVEGHEAGVIVGRDDDGQFRITLAWNDRVATAVGAAAASAMVTLQVSETEPTLQAIGLTVDWQ